MKENDNTVVARWLMVSLLALMFLLQLWTDLVDPELRRAELRKELSQLQLY